MEKDLLKLPEFIFEEYPREKYTFNVPHDDDLLFSENETWAYIKDGRAIVGVTDWAQRIMGDLLYFTPPEVGAEIEQFASLGELESGKAVLEMA
ncbi:MAG: glycine cleavage system protein H, partial [Firmicutes bacterium]|nr:glycine cleavage system protein H [Bacillota bacterium]